MRVSTIGPAGWLFADLLLAFGLIFLGVSSTLPGRPTAATPSPSPSPSRSASPQPAPVQNVVSINSICRVLASSTRVAALTDAALNDALAGALQDLRLPPSSDTRAGVTGPQAKLIVTFGYGASVPAGEVLARRVNARFHDPALIARLGNLLTSPTLDIRDYGYGSAPEGQVSIELFVAYDGPLPAQAYPQQKGCVGKP